MVLTSGIAYLGSFCIFGVQRLASTLEFEALLFNDLGTQKERVKKR